MKIKTALIGLGRIAWSLENDSKRQKPCTHLGTYRAFPDEFEITGGFDLSAEKSKTFNEANPDIPVFPSVNELLSATEAEQLSVATPAETHLDVVNEILKCKPLPKLIWLEKPVELNLKRAQKLKKLTNKAGIPVLVNHERRYHPDYMALKELIRNKALGTLKSVHAQMLLSASSKMPAGSGTLLEDGTHLLDILFYLTGEKCLKTECRIEFLKEKKVEKRVYGLLEFDSFPVFLDSGGDRRYFHFELDLSFTEGRARIGNGFFEVFKAADSPYYDGFKSLISERVVTEPKNMFLNLGEDIIEFFKTGRLVRSTLSDAIKVMELVDKIYRSN